MTEAQALIARQAAEIEALHAEIARLNTLLSDINAAWQADRQSRRPAVPGDRVIYELYQEDKDH